jgi:hypothetical protein
MDKIGDISRRRKEAHAKLQSLGSKVYDASFTWRRPRSRTGFFRGR